MDPVVVRDKVFTRASEHNLQSISDLDSTWNSPYSFVFIADPQPGLIDVIENEGPGHVWKEELRRVNLAVKSINLMKPKPKFVCIGGDILNEFPLGKDTGGIIREKQYSDLKCAFSHLDSSIPLLSVSGNHDVGNTPTEETVSMYKQFYGDDYYSFVLGGVFYIIINSQFFFDSSKCHELASQQEQWLETQLQRSKSEHFQHTILFMHIPLFVSNPDEEDYYFNICKEKRIELLERFADAGISKVFCGHYHRNAGGNWSSTSGSDVEVIVSSAVGCQLGDDQAGIRIVNVLQDKIVHRYFQLDNVPESSLLY